MRVISLLLGAVGVLSFVSAPASAQESGFWLSLGLGYGSANNACDMCVSGPRLDGGTASLRLGGTPSSHVRLGGGVDVWTHTSAGQTETLGNVDALLYYYPFGLRRGVFISGGLGYSNYGIDSDPSLSGGGWGYTVSVGDDIRVGRRVALTPNLTYGYGGVGEIDDSYGNVFATGWTQNWMSLGLAVTFFSGHRHY